jgi:hypothetical protein
MKTAIKSEMTKRNFDELTSILSDVTLDLHAMSCVRGGDGEANGGEPIIIIPPKEG